MGPVYAQIGVTDRCNLRCLCCWFYSPLVTGNPYREEAATLSYEDYSRLIRELHDLGCRYIILVGFGEPLLHPRIMDMLADAKRLGFNCGICTNGTLLTDRVVDRLIGMGIDRIDVSVWAGSAVTYLKTHPGCTDKTFGKIEHAMLRLAEIKRERGLDIPYIKILDVICNKNYTDIAEMVDFAIEMNVEEIIFQPIMAVPGATDALLLSDEQAASVREILNSLREKVEKGPLLFANIDEYLARVSSPSQSRGDYDLGKINSIPCTIGWRFMVTLANGDVLGCCNGAGRPMGNFLARPLKEIWRAPAYREFRKRCVEAPRSPSDEYFSPFCCQTRCPHYLECLDVSRQLDELPAWKKALLKTMSKVLPR